MKTLQIVLIRVTSLIGMPFTLQILLHLGGVVDEALMSISFLHLTNVTIAAANIALNQFIGVYTLSHHCDNCDCI